MDYLVLLDLVACERGEYCRTHGSNLGQRVVPRLCPKGMACDFDHLCHAHRPGPAESVLFLSSPVDGASRWTATHHHLDHLRLRPGDSGTSPLFRIRLLGEDGAVRLEQRVRLLQSRNADSNVGVRW